MNHKPLNETILANLHAERAMAIQSGNKIRLAWIEAQIKILENEKNK